MRNATTHSRRRTLNPADGPAMTSGAPPRKPTITPPTAAVIKPSDAGIPDARAIPMERGSAIKNTTIEGGRSLMTVRILSFKTRASLGAFGRLEDGVAVTVGEGRAEDGRRTDGNPNVCTGGHAGRRIVGMTPSGEGEQN